MTQLVNLFSPQTLAMLNTKMLESSFQYESSRLMVQLRHLGFGYYCEGQLDDLNHFITFANHKMRYDDVGILMLPDYERVILAFKHKSDASSFLYQFANTSSLQPTINFDDEDF